MVASLQPNALVAVPRDLALASGIRLPVRGRLAGRNGESAAVAMTRPRATPSRATWAPSSLRLPFSRTLLLSQERSSRCPRSLGFSRVSAVFSRGWRSYSCSGPQMGGFWGSCGTPFPADRRIFPVAPGESDVTRVDPADAALAAAFVERRRQRLKLFRERAGLTLAAVGEAMDVSTSTVHRW